MTRIAGHRAPSLQGQLLVRVLGLVVLVWMLTATLIWFDARHELDELLDGHLAQSAALLVTQQRHELAENDHQVDTPTLHRYAPRAAFQVFHDGRLVLRTSNAPSAPMFEALDGHPSGFRTVDFDNATWRVFATTSAMPDVRVFVGEQVASRNVVLRAVLRSAMWPMMGALPALALAVWWSVRRGVLPLRRLGGVLGERRTDDIQPVIVDGAPSEMAPALDALNGLLHRIGDLLESERRFTADAAHELRTPIAAIRAQAQVALGATDEAQRRHALTATLSGCDRAARLVEQLLTLARLEAAAATIQSPVNLSVLVRQVIMNLAPQAARKHQAVELQAADGCIVRGDATLLEVLVRNLVDNAIRYSPTGATVKIRLETSLGRIHLHVDDSGPGLSAVDLKRMGERFFRVLGSGEDGSGLGWSIVRRIAAVHGVEIGVGRSQALGGLGVEVAWPG